MVFRKMAAVRQIVCPPQSLPLVSQHENGYAVRAGLALLFEKLVQAHPGYPETEDAEPVFTHEFWLGISTPSPMLIREPSRPRRVGDHPEVGG